jgi:hypothetical protein
LGRKEGEGREFVFFFKSISNLFQTFLIYIFSISNFNTNFSNYFKDFSKTF